MKVLNAADVRHEICNVDFPHECTAEMFAALMSNVCKAVDALPVLDMEPVKRGRWVANNFCSECKTGIEGWARQQGYHYCPHCGARMDKGVFE